MLKPSLPITLSFAQLTPCVHSLSERVPYEGTSRMQTSLRRRQRDRVVRRGLAMMIESDFYATDAGRQHFAGTSGALNHAIC